MTEDDQTKAIKFTGDLQTAYDAGVANGALTSAISPRVSFIESEDGAVKIPIALVDGPDGAKIEVLQDAMEQIDRRLPGPIQRTGTFTLTEVDSFIAAVKRWATPSAVIYAQVGTFTFAAVLDDHPAGATGTAWRNHRIAYACPRSNEWKLWTAADGKAMSQTEFADFVESRLEDLIDPAKLNPPPSGTYPAPLEVLQMARDLQIFTKGTFQRTIDPTTGAYTFINKNENTTGSTVIPRAFLIGIPVFEGGDRYQLEARVRFAISDGGPRFSFTLHRRAEIERDAFDKVRAKVAAETVLPLFAGTP